MGRALAADPEVTRCYGKSLSSGEAAKIYGFTDLDGSRPDCWRYVVEVPLRQSQRASGSLKMRRPRPLSAT